VWDVFCVRNGPVELKSGLVQAPALGSITAPNDPWLRLPTIECASESYTVWLPTIECAIETNAEKFNSRWPLSSIISGCAAETRNVPLASGM